MAGAEANLMPFRCYSKLIHSVGDVEYMRYTHRMITTIRRSGNSFVIRVPREEMERIGVEEGEHVSVEIRAIEVRPKLPADLRASVEAEIARSARAFQRLADA